MVALHAKGNAVCSFDVDHIFPWCRGGKTVDANLMACYWGANRNVKVRSRLLTLADWPASFAADQQVHVWHPALNRAGSCCP